LHRAHFGASWASGAAQAAQFVGIILRFLRVLLGLRGGLTRLEKPVFQLRNAATRRMLYRRRGPSIEGCRVFKLRDNAIAES